MKRLVNIFPLLLIAGFTLLAGCKKDDQKPETERILDLLSAGVWQVEYVLVNETDQTTSFTGLTLSFTATNYATTNGGVVWPSAGSWTFVDNTAKKILRNDGLEITIIEINQESLKLSLNNPTTTIGTGRVTGTAGEHEFGFTKN